MIKMRKNNRTTQQNSLVKLLQIRTVNHRVLVFVQLKDMLQCVEQDLFKKNMPNVTYRVLDVNNSIKIKGGLGLNLAGADVVCSFFNHTSCLLFVLCR